MQRKILKSAKDYINIKNKTACKIKLSKDEVAFANLFRKILETNPNVALG